MFDEKFIIDLKSIPNTFNIGKCTLQVGDEACPREDSPIMYPDAWIFLKNKLEQENLKPDDALIPASWKLNLLTRVYVEFNQPNEALKVNERARAMSGESNIVAVANSVVVFRCLGRNREATDIANELNEKQDDESQTIRSQLIDAISEQAYYHSMFNRSNAYTGSIILDFVFYLRNSFYTDHEKYLMIKFYRRLVHPKNESDKVKNIDTKILSLLRDIENSTQNDTMKALVYLQMEIILNDNTDMKTEFSNKGELRSQSDFIELALKFGENNPLILLEVGINKIKRKYPDQGKEYIKHSFSIQPSERASKILAKMYLQEALAFTDSDEKTVHENEADTIRQYLLNYASYLDWTKTEQIKDKLDQALFYSRKRFELLITKSLKSLLLLSKILVKCKQYEEACALIDENYLMNSSGRSNVLVEVHINILRAIAEEAQHDGLNINEQSNECIKYAVKLAYSETDADMKFITGDELLNRLQKIPSLKTSTFLTLNGANVEEKIKDYLQRFAPLIEHKHPKKFNNEFLEILLIRNAVFLIEKKSYEEAIKECDKIINDTVCNNIFSKIQALILKSKVLILKTPSSKENIVKSKRLLEKAYRLYHSLDETTMVSEKRLLKYLQTSPLSYSYFFDNSLN